MVEYGAMWLLYVLKECFYIPCRSLKIWMKSLLDTFSQWRHLPVIYWGISIFRSAMGESKRYILLYWASVEYSVPSLFYYMSPFLFCSLLDRKWRSYWSGQRGRSLLLFHTLFRLVKICQGSSYWATSLVENHGEQKCFLSILVEKCWVDFFGN